MTTVVYKYPLPLTGPDIKEVLMPRGANVLTVACQNGVLCLWAVVPTETQIADHRRFLVIGTGFPMPEKPSRYIGTVHLQGGSLVLHVFEMEGFSW